MGETVKSNSIFTENYNGILTHEGTIKVAKTEITAKILDITKRTVLVRGNKRNGFYCEIHKDLYPLMSYVEKGDIAFIKWANGKSYMVGFKKNQKSNSKNKNLEKQNKNNEDDWSSFFNVGGKQ